MLKEIQKLLRDIMTGIYDRCLEHGITPSDDCVDCVKGANITAFIKVADEMLAYGVVWRCRKTLQLATA